MSPWIAPRSGWSMDEPVEIREQDGRMIIEPIQASKPDLALLVRGAVPADQVKSLDWVIRKAKRKGKARRLSG